MGTCISAIARPQPVIFSLEESQKLQSYASKAEGYIDSVNKIDLVLTVLKHSVSDKLPLTAIVFNLLYSEDSDFNKEIAHASFSESLYKVTVPVLILWGKYDFTCPSGLGRRFFIPGLNSTDKKMVFLLCQRA